MPKSLLLALALVVAVPGVAAPSFAAGCANDFPWFAVRPLAVHAAASARGLSNSARGLAVNNKVVSRHPAGVRFALASREGDWCQVRSEDGAAGWTLCDRLDPTWIEVRKVERRMVVHRGETNQEYPIHLGANPIDDKVQVGSPQEPHHWRTPEGVFYVCRKLPTSTYYKALLLSYPNAEDAERGLAAKLISPEQADAIRRAITTRTCPPMNTKLGGAIEIHGNDQPDAGDWTWGCVATTDRTMDTIYAHVAVGTPVLICP